MEYQLHTQFPLDLERDWNQLLERSASHVPFLRCDYLRAWWDTRGGGEWPSECTLAIVTAWQDGSLAGIAPLFRVPDHQGQPRLMLLGSIEISDYLDLIAPPDVLADFIDGLLVFLTQAELPRWQALDLYNLPDDSPSLPVLTEAAGRHGFVYRQEKLQHAPCIPLPGDWETYLASIDKKQRHEIRRKMRRVENAEVPVRWYIVRDADRLDAEIAAFFDLMKQDDAKARFLSAKMQETMREVMRCAFEEGCLQLAFLEVDGKKAAGYVSFDYQNRIWVYNSGLNRDFYEYSPGWVLLGYLLRWANEQGRSEFDFMRGNEEYKYRFGAIDRSVVRACLTRRQDLV
jgi:CelD/BcsL family acetyltransferase involved in cellulose biosynthesis